MRIGIEAQRILRTKRHGMDIVALEMIRSLQKLDKTNEYFVFVKPDADQAALQETENFKIISLDAPHYAHWEQIVLPKAANRLQLDLLHCTSNTAPLFTRIPLLITLHDIIYLENWNLTQGTWYQRIGNLYRRALVPRIAGKCQKVITVSHFEKKTILRHFQKEMADKVQVVYNGVGAHFLPGIDENTRRRVITEHNLPDNFLFFIGNTDPKKNVLNVLKALKILKENNKLKGKMVMPDYNRNHLLQILRLIKAESLLDDIHLTGYVNNRDLPVFYQESRLFLYPSLRESFGIPMLEAMCSGTPVICSNTSSMPEVAGDAAIYVNPNNPEEIASAIEMVWGDDDLRKSLVERGKRVAPSFTWEKTAQGVLDIYHSLYRHQR